ncbi:MAG: NAD(P)-dependent oxidoreductase [Candidatus Hydrogenedentes bacterium]|nr:NAD(P)-dependent oxidoreductase [Candidatus Hydrogenedentota bacterium]
MGRRTVLVTGTNGRLGSAVACRLAAEYDVVQLDVKEPEPGQAGFGRVLVGSITDLDTVERAVDGVDAVVHCAAIPWEKKPFQHLVQVNVMGTLNLLEAAGVRQRVEHFIYISSICAHGILSGPDGGNMPRFLPINEDHPLLLGNYYSCSKVQAEYWCRKYADEYRKPVVAVRPSLIIASEAETSMRARPPGETPRLYDYVACSDLVEGIVRAMDYYPVDGFDRFLFNAVDQCSTMPSVDLVNRLFPDVEADREALRRADGFGALVDCAYARERLGWIPRVRCQR